MGHLTYGISGEDPAMFTDPRFATLGLHHARVQVSWDLLTHTDAARYPGLASERARLSVWLAAARRAHIDDVLVAIKASRDTRGELPDAATYADGLHRLFAWLDQRGAGDLVHALSPWNEPDRSVATRADAARPARSTASCATSAGHVAAPRSPATSPTGA